MHVRTDPSKDRPRYPATVPGFFTPPVLWVVYFVAIYSLHGVVCAGDFQGALVGVDTLPNAIILITLGTVVAQVGVGFWSYRVWRRITRRPQADVFNPQVRASFLVYAALLNAGLFTVATLWVGIPAFMLEPCI